jgi:hypothetical protein
MMDDKGVILSAVILTVGSGIVVGATKGQAPQFNQFLAGGFMGAFLFGVSLIDEEVAKLLAILIIIGILLRNGDSLFAFVAKSNTKVQTSASTSTATIRNA